MTSRLPSPGTSPLVSRSDLAVRSRGFRVLLLLVFTLGATLPLAAQEDEAAKKKDDEAFHAVRAARVLPISGPEIEGGIVLFRKGKIEKVLKKDGKVPAGVEIEDLGPDSVLLPALINPYTNVNLLGSRVKGSRSGMASFATGFSTRDGQKYRAIDQIRPTDEIYKKLATTGYGALGVVPSYRYLVSGRAAVVETLETKDRGEMTLVEDGYLLMGYVLGASHRKATEVQFQKAIEVAKKIREEAKKKAQPPKKPEPPKKPPEGQKPQPGQKPSSSSSKPTQPTPLAEVFLKKRSAVIFIGAPAAVDHFILLFRSLPEKFEFTLVTTVLEEDVVARLATLKDHLKGVILQPGVGRIADTAIYLNTARLVDEQGLPVSFVPLRDDLEGHRDMFYYLASMVKSGMKPESVLKGVTLNPARVLGIEKSRGTLEAGKDASFVVFDRDPLSGLARVEAMYTRGKRVVPEPKKSDETEVSP